MNTNYKFYILSVFLFVGLVPCATYSDNLKAGSFKWKIPFDGSESAPVIYDGTIYIGSFDGAIYAINPKSGKQIWRYQTGKDSPRDNAIYISGKSFGEMLGTALDATSKKRKGKREIDATPVIENGVVYVGSKDHNFYALDAKTGELKWATGIDRPVFYKAIIAKNNIIVHGIGMGLSQNAIYALREADGKIVWSTEDKGSATYPFLSDDVLYYVLSEDDYTGSKQNLSFSMNAVDVNTGDLLWKLELQGHRPKKVYGSANLVYISAFKKEGMVPNARNNGFYELEIAYIYAINASTGKLVWEFKGGKVSYYTPPTLTLDSKHLYFTSENGLYMLDKNTGKQAWFLEGKFSAYNITIDKLLYVYGEGNRFYAINPKTGKVIWTYKDKNIWHTKVLANTVHISAEQSLVALNASTGKKLWKFKTGSFLKAGTNVSATPLIFKNHVIFPTGTKTFFGKDSIQGHLFSIDAHTGKVE